MERNQLMRLYRIASWLRRKNINFIARCLEYIIRIVYACELHGTTKIGEGTLFIHNGLGCVVHPKASIGKKCRIYQNVTIGGRNNRGTPIIGNNVFIGPGACVLGGVVIGDNVVIAANSVVIKSLPNGVWGGIPAKRLKNE